MMVFNAASAAALTYSFWSEIELRINGKTFSKNTSNDLPILKARLSKSSKPANFLIGSVFFESKDSFDIIPITSISTMYYIPRHFRSPAVPYALTLIAFSSLLSRKIFKLFVRYVLALSGKNLASYGMHLQIDL